jgi:hypothetical protein
MAHITRVAQYGFRHKGRISRLGFVGFTVMVIFSSIVQAQWTTSGNNISNTNSGNVGVGTTTPGARLDVQADAATAGFLLGRFGNNNANGGGAVRVYANTTTNGTLYPALEFSDSTYWLGSVTGDRTNGLRFRTGSNVSNGESALTNRMVISPSGNVGIGAISPSYLLDVQGSAQWVARFKKTDASHGGILIDTASGYNPNLAMAVNGAIKWYMNSNSANGDTLQFWESTGATPRLTLTQAGSVGVGTGTPGFRLDVQGGQINSSAGLCIAGDCKTAWSQVGGGGGSQWTTSGANIFYNAGYVGVGASAGPVARLDVRQISNNGSYATLLTSYGANEDTYLRGGSSAAVLHIGDLSATTATVLLAESGGNVGIGTTTPTKKLDVNGDVNASGTITAGNVVARYQDVAEWVDASQPLPAGTVVVIDRTRANQVIASAQAYDTRVAGVVSAQPGITLGEKGDNKVLIATTGRVRIRVDASRAPIRIGDLLVTSDLAGLAMKSEPLIISGREMHAPGTLIGKALEPLAQGKGEILVLLSLQ